MNERPTVYAITVRQTVNGRIYGITGAVARQRLLSSHFPILSEMCMQLDRGLLQASGCVLPNREWSCVPEGSER